MKMNCEQAEKALVAGVEPDGCRSLAAHLAECGACRDMAGFLRETAAMPWPEKTPPLPAAALAACGDSRTGRLRRWRFLFLTAAALGMAAVILATHFHLRRLDAGGDGAPVYLAWDRYQDELGEVEAAIDACGRTLDFNMAEMFRINWEEVK